MKIVSCYSINNFNFLLKSESIKFSYEINNYCIYIIYSWNVFRGSILETKINVKAISLDF